MSSTILIYRSRSFFLCLCWLLTCLSHSFGQISNADSLSIARLIEESNEQINKHDFTGAISTARRSLDQSARSDFRWGSIQSFLLIGQAQKALRNYPEGLNNYLQALSEIKKRNDPTLSIFANVKIGELFQEWGVPEKALPYYTAALSLYEDNTKEPWIALVEKIAEVHLGLNQREISLGKYFLLLRIVREKGDVPQTRRILEKIAFIYSQSNDIENSLKYNLQLLQIKQTEDDASSEAATLNVIGNQYKDLKNSDKALEYYQAALSKNMLNNRLGKNDNSIVANLINIGSVYQERGDNRNAVKSFNEALQLKEKSGTSVELAVMHNYLATLYLTQGNYPDAENETRLSIDLLKGTDNKRILARNYKRLSEIYEKQYNYEKALESYQSYSMVKDSLLYQEQITQEKERLKEYVIETTEKEAKLNLIDHEMQALELRNEKEMAERERQQIELRLKEQELQNLSLQKEQLEQAREVQQLQLKQNKVEKVRQEQAIILLEQKRDLQNAEIQKKELLEIEKQKEIDFKNTRLELQQSQLERIGIRQQLLIYTALLFLLIILLILMGYLIKRRDNKKLQVQFDEINRQKLQIESINKNLLELNEEKNDLISIVAHDLKSPLNQISGMLEIIKLTAKDQSAEQQEYIGKIDQSTTRLKKMITKILDVSAIESQTLSIIPEKLNIVNLLEEITNRFLLPATKKEITIIKEYEDSIPAITSDMSYVAEVLENLMSNAVKFSPLGKRILVKLKTAGQFVRIEFIDQGQGISEKDLKNLFGKYHKLSARPTAGEDSTGLGLSIVKKYVEALHGKVWCESEEGKGSDFIVELPISFERNHL